MATILAAAVEHYRQMQRLQLVAVKASRRAWGRVDGRFITQSWNDALSQLLPVLAGIQVQAAAAGATYSAPTLAEQGTYIPPEDFTDPRAFGGYASDGRDLAGLLYSPATTTKEAIAAGYSLSQALATGRSALDRIVSTTVADTGRQAAGVDVVTRPAVGYVRMLNPPSCSRCTILAGRFYRWNAGFLRHPRCDCVHVASRAGSTQAALDEGLVDDPYQAFNAMSEADQDRAFGKANAQAIRDGADISQVVNARRGMTANGNFTTEGTSRRGNAGAGLKRSQRRMTPELIYKQAGGDRERALQLLREHGYVLPRGQVAGGALRGQAEGFGQMGRGGTRRAASQAVLDARATGSRDARDRYTMTAAERRLYDAELRYLAVLEGRDPFQSPGFGNRPDPTGALTGYGRSSASGRIRPVTPDVAARVESEYRLLLATRGQVFTA
ncbi:hypothetical protein [Isoptericola sp. QY 916]|uniref:VG15 protein n=1 Tax=Isoptericola sp. QY 916 TaxID=2782570 RepID=UPI003D2FDBF3|nr:hypothetical protein [Isoptericola sp. QY 916]